MSSVGTSSEQAHALIASGLRLADQSDLTSALNHWELATEFDPDMRAAVLLVELTEAYLEARETGIDLGSPNFRSHLHEIGYLLPNDLRETSDGPARRRPAGGPDPRDASQPPVPTISGSHRDRTWQGPDTSPNGPHPGRTVYGLPHRSPADSEVPTTKPRYRAVEPPPPTHRHRSSTPAPGDSRPRERRRSAERKSHQPGQVDHQAPTALTRTGEGPPGQPPENLPEDSDFGFDPWADLGSELAQVSSGEWTIPINQDASSEASAPLPDLGAPPPAKGPASAWDDTEQASATRKRPVRRRTGPRPSATGDFDLDDDLPEPLRDPFAVLDDYGLRERPLTSPGIGFIGESAPTKPRADSASQKSVRQHSAARPAAAGLEGEDSDLFGLFDDENLPEGDPFHGEPLLQPDAGDSRKASLLLDDDEPDELIIEEDLVEEGFDFELIDEQSGEVITNPVYTAPYDDDAPDDVGRSQENLWVRAQEHQSLGDYTSSEEILTELLELEPSNRRAQKMLEENQRQQEKRHLAKLRSVEATPRLVLGQEQLVWQNLDAKKGFILSRVDGLLTVEDIIDIASLPRHETLRILADLVDEGILAMT